MSDDEVVTNPARRLTVVESAPEPDPDLVASRMIGVAIGITMTTYKMVYEQAYALLRLASRRQNRDLREVAENVVEQSNATMAGGKFTALRSLRSRLRSTLSPSG